MEQDVKQLKADLDAARNEFESLITEAKDAQTHGWDGAGDTAEVLKLQMRVEARRLVFEMRAADYQQALHEAAERRNEAEERRHREEVRSIEERAHAAQRENNQIQKRMVSATYLMVLATIVAAVASGLQAWAALRH